MGDLAYKMRFGDFCEEKMLNPKGEGGDIVMKMIENANNMLVVSVKAYAIINLGRIFDWINI